MTSELTVGVEEEYQLVDAETGALHSRAPDVLTTDWSAEIRPELHETTLEVGTRICASAAALEGELRRLRFQVATAAAAEGLDIVAAGTHPFSKWEDQRPSTGDRYREILERYRRIARDEHNFGMHVHVAVPPGLDRIELLNRVRGYIPHLIALAGSSPFFEGQDTGYCSYRMVLWRRWPNSGIPPKLSGDHEYRRFIDLLRHAGAIADERGLYWGIRPHAIYPTLEFRITDSCPRIDDAVAIAALIRAMVVAAVDGALDAHRCTGFSESAEHAMLQANEWMATRHGLEALVGDPDGRSGRTPMRTAIRRLVDRVVRTAEAIGDGAAFAHVEAILERGNGADRMRRIARDDDGLEPLVRWLIAETRLGTGLDRRRAQRERCA